MKIRDIITERASDFVLHATSLRNALNILNDSKFKLSTGLPGEDQIEKKFLDPKRPYFLSVARSRQSYFFFEEMADNIINIVFVMNGDWFNRRYKSSKVKYFTDKKDEMEDRILHYKPFINFSGQETQLIKEIWITLPSRIRVEDGKIFNYIYFQQQFNALKYILEFADKNNISIKVYKDLISMTKNKNMLPLETITDVLNKLENDDADYSKQSAPVFSYEKEINLINELIRIPSNQKLTDEQKTIFGYDDYNIINIIRNTHKSKPEELQSIIQLFRRKNIKNIYELIEFLKNKFKDQLDENT